MATIKIIDPVSRIEGHMKVKIEIDQNEITDAKVSGTLFRGFEQILNGRAPDDAPLLTQRICGVCPVSQAQASVLALENIVQNNGGFTLNNNAKILRNLVLGANFIQSHIMHFYLLTLPDYVAGPPTSPWKSAWTSAMKTDSRLDGIIENLESALNYRRNAHVIGALFGGKLPHAASNMAGGMTCDITMDKIRRFESYLYPMMSFLEETYIKDVEKVAAVYNDYHNIGKGPENLLSYGAFEDVDGNKLFDSGYLAKGGTTEPLSRSMIREHVTYSWYEYDDDSKSKHPDAGVTDPVDPKNKMNAYSWIKAPRYNGKPVEVGPLARMKISGHYSGGISVMDRHLARAHEARLLVDKIIGWEDYAFPNLGGWLATLSIDSAYNTGFSHGTGQGEGLTEAPRGSLGHWVNIKSDGTLDHYQVISPTCWNASPMDDEGIKGPMEQALIGTPIENMNQPIEALRVIHSFDPCLACAVHVMRPSGEPVAVIHTAGK